jgi:hypothetical protein
MSQLNAQQIASLLKQQGIPDKQIPTMTAIALAESGGRSKAYNPTGLDKSYGLFQVNMYGGLGPARMKQFGLSKEQDLFDPTTNVKAAKQILGSQGLGAWSVYKSGKYKDFLPQAQQAAQNLPDLQQQTTTPQDTAKQSGRTFIIFGDTQPAVNPKNYLENYILQNIAGSSTPQFKTGFDPASMLTQAFFQTPNYLGGD